MRIEARAPAKLVLFGEYAVLEGSPAVVAAVDRCATVTLSTHAGDAWTASTDLDGGRQATLSWSKDRRLRANEAEAATWIAPLVVVFEAAVAFAEVDPTDLPAVHVRVETAPLYVRADGQKLGLGSSAAVVTALGAAARQWLLACGVLAEAIDETTAFDQDLAAHHRLQGGGSGVDVAASAHGGLLAYVRADGGDPPAATVERLRWPRGLGFRCIWTGVAASTRELVACVGALKNKQREDYDALMARMDALARRACEAFRSTNTEGVVALAADYHRAMDELGKAAGAPIVSDAHRTLADLAHREGTTYKPSGAGGGDIGLLFSVSLDALSRAARQAADRGFRVLDLRIQDRGASVGST